MNHDNQNYLNNYRSQPRCHPQIRQISWQRQIVAMLNNMLHEKLKILEVSSQILHNIFMEKYYKMFKIAIIILIEII